MSPLVYLTIAVAALLFVAGRAAVSRMPSRRGRIALLVLASTAALPGLVFAGYYTHRFDRASWFYEFRSWPGTEIAAAGLGLLAGVVDGHLRRRLAGKASRMFMALVSVVLAGVAALVVAVPYAKPIVAPLDPDLRDVWREGVCIQTTPSTCGPSSLATLLAARGIPATERGLARECFTCGSGTENWYLARAIRRRGLRASVAIDREQPAAIPCPCIAGTEMGGRGGAKHYVAVLTMRGDRYVVGDPMAGRREMTLAEIEHRYYLTGFFLLVR